MVLNITVEVGRVKGLMQSLLFPLEKRTPHLEYMVTKLYHMPIPIKITTKRIDLLQMKKIVNTNRIKKCEKFFKQTTAEKSHLGKTRKWGKIEGSEVDKQRNQSRFEASKVIRNASNGAISSKVWFMSQLHKFNRYCQSLIPSLVAKYR